MLYFSNFSKVDQAQFSRRAEAPPSAWMLWKTHICRALCFVWILSDYRFRETHDLFAKSGLVHRKPIRVIWYFSSLLCVGHTKRRRINHNCYCFFDWHPSSPSGDWCGMCCARISYSRRRRSKIQTAQISTQKNCSCRLCRTHGPWENISIKFIM